MARPESCIACDKPFFDGEMVLADVSGGFIHAACCGPERESYVGLESGAPIGPDEPIPSGFAWTSAETRGKG